MNRKTLALKTGKALLWLAVFFAASLIADWWRSPNPPANAADLPLHTLAGRDTTLRQSSSGQTLLLYLCAPSCGICRRTSPAIEQLRADGVSVIGVAMQSGSDADIGRYLAGHGWHFDTVNDSGTLARQWQVRAVPTVVLVRNGRIVHSTSGIASYYGLKSRIRLADWKDG